jgi:hypothetical protein
MNDRTLRACACVLSVVVAPFAMTAAIAATPTRGTIYVGAGFSQHDIYRIEYAYDGADTLTTSPPVFVAHTSAGSYGHLVTPDRHLLVVGEGTMASVSLSTNVVTPINPHNNGNTVALDPDGATAWVGWKDTPLASVPLNPPQTGTPHNVRGDDGVATAIAFTPANGAFYTTGGEDRNGNVGAIDLTTFQTTRYISDIEATGIAYDAFSSSLIVAAFGKSHQIDPTNPSTIISSRDDSSNGESYIDLKPDGLGHLLTTRYGATSGALVLLDYSESGLIGDPSTRYVSAPIDLPAITDLAYDPELFADSFDP